MGAEPSLDAIARELASGGLSRRAALKRLLAVGLGISVVPADAAAALGGGCPGNRVKCDGKCCPKGAKCKKGKCRCTDGKKKCGNKCVDLDTSPKHCGGCGVACTEGETCVSGECTGSVDCGAPGQTCCPGDACTSPSDCCSGGICTSEGNACSEASTVCDGGTCVPCGGLGQHCCQDGTCAEGRTCCGTCVDLTYDPNCGYCGADCWQVCGGNGYCNGAYCECFT